MLFTTWGFWGFFVVVVALFYSLPATLRKYLLLGASLFFYMCWNVRYVWILGGLITLDYFATRLLAERFGIQRKIFLIVSVAANLGLLIWFKYIGFLVSSFSSVFQATSRIGIADAMIPLGISFHTFQSISYVVDVYRGQYPPVRNYFDYALFVSFFPQLVAGPIVRAKQFFADLDNWHAPSLASCQRATLLIALGLAKKLVCADSFGSRADLYFASPATYPGMVSAWTGTLAFGLQIYFDFSGYTDIAIGTAALLGFHFPLNFRRPYLASSPADFWHRWHISLSTWIRDYLYIPMGGNRHGLMRTYRNLLITMVLGGLWHGASWTFVVWGLYHGILLSAERLIGGKAPSWFGAWVTIPKTIFTFLLVQIGWVFFRAASLRSAVFVLGQMFRGHGGRSLLDTWDWRLAGVTLVIALAQEVKQEVKMDWRDYFNLPWVRTGAVVGLLLAVELFSFEGPKRPFIYFQF